MFIYSLKDILSDPKKDKKEDKEDIKKEKKLNWIMKKKKKETTLKTENQKDDNFSNFSIPPPPISFYFKLKNDIFIFLDNEEKQPPTKPKPIDIGPPLPSLQTPAMLPNKILNQIPTPPPRPITITTPSIIY